MFCGLKQMRVRENLLFSVVWKNCQSRSQQGACPDTLCTSLSSIFWRSQASGTGCNIHLPTEHHSSLAFTTITWTQHLPCYVCLRRSSHDHRNL